MDASKARDHVEMIERIIAASSQKLEAGGEFFLVWGLASGTFSVITQLIMDRRLPVAAFWLSGLLGLGAVVFSIVRGRYYRASKDRVSLLQREFLNVLYLAMGIAFIVNCIGYNIFSYWASAAIWSAMAAIVLFYIGMHGNRRAQIGGIIVIVSIAAANFASRDPGYLIAAGMYLGYAGFGLAELLARD